MTLKGLLAYTPNTSSDMVVGYSSLRCRCVDVVSARVDVHVAALGYCLQRNFILRIYGGRNSFKL